MSAPTALGDIADEVLQHLATGLAADDDRRPYIRSNTNTGMPMCLRIKHFDGRPTWVLQHGNKDNEKEVRYAMSDTLCAVELLFQTTCQTGGAVHLCHGGSTLFTTYVDMRSKKHSDPLVSKLVAMVKKAV
eukprot:1347614-Prymnesium_polylepis.1